MKVGLKSLKRLIFGVVGMSILLLSGCTAFIPITDPMKKLFVGRYVAMLSEDRVVELVIHTDLSFDYEEDSFLRGHVSKVFRSGDVKAMTERTARAGMVYLQWVSPQNIRAKSPYGGVIRNTTGGMDRRGVAFSDGYHEFYMSRR